MNTYRDLGRGWEWAHFWWQPIEARDADNDEENGIVHAIEVRRIEDNELLPDGIGSIKSRNASKDKEPSNGGTTQGLRRRRTQA